MRTNTHFFSRGERKAAVWAVVAAVALSALGLYERMGQTQLVGVIEAQPLG